MAVHDFGANALFTTLGAGTFTNAQNVGGTAGGLVAAGVAEYHLFAFFGTLANTGTINVYSCTNSGGSSPNLLSTLIVGSSNGAGAAIGVKSDTVNGVQGGTSGTAFTHLAAAGTIDAGGTWRGALVCISTWARTAGTVGAPGGLSAYGTSLY